MEWSLQIKRVPEVIVKAVLSLNEGVTTTTVKGGSVMSNEFAVKVVCIERLCIITTFVRNSDGCGN